ncbi:MAG: SGNH/GDSL hydrolase family protein, partial [Acidobacteria bacterium]|nr:SGNH/GDSL hydrolase family protein [Acidobacteriota bacterium]
MRRAWANAALLLAAPVLSLAVVELVMVWLDYDYRPLTISARDNLRDTLAFNEEHFEFDQRLLWRPRRGYKIFNRQGFRGPVLGPERRRGEVRIATVGDSNTLGWRGEDGAHWPGLLDCLAGSEVRVVNAGVWGYSSFQGVLRLREVLPLAPDVVTISFGSNDARPVRVADAERSGANRAGAILKGQFGRLRLGRVLIGGVDRLWALGAPGKMRRRVGLARYRDNLRTMIGETRAAGARPVLMTRPYIG